MTYLTKESQFIYDLIQKLGTITVSQITKIDTAHNPLSTVKFLYGHNYINLIADNYAVPFQKKTENAAPVACLWAMLALITDDNGNIDKESLSSIVEGNEIINFSYIHNQSFVVNMVYLDNSYFTKVNMIKQRFYNFNNVDKGHEKDAGIIHIFATDNPEVAVEASKMDITIPHKIMLIEGDMTQEPAVKIL